MKCYIPSTHSTIITDTVEFILTVIPSPKTSSEDYLRKYITYILSLLEDPKTTVTSLSLGDDTQNSVKQTAKIINRSIPATSPIKTKITHISPQPTSPSELTPKSPVLAPHPAPTFSVV